VRFVFARCHRLGVDEKIMQASQARKSDLMRCVQQIFGLGEQFLGMFLRQELHETLRADACPAGEQPLKVILAQADG
jgi:hypothetical protein